MKLHRIPFRRTLRAVAVVGTTLLLLGCADPAFDQYIQSRRAQIAAMPAGPAKWAAQENLEQVIYQGKREQQARAAQTTQAMATAALIGLEASQPPPAPTVIIYPYY